MNYGKVMVLKTGTVMLKDLSATSAYAADFTLYKNKVFFTAGTAVTGSNFWVTDGTETGTKTIQPASTTTFTASLPGLVILKDRLVFAAVDETTGPLNEWRHWISDGTEEGTTVLYDNADKYTLYGAGSGFFLDRDKNIQVFNGQAYFLGENGENGLQVWVNRWNKRRHQDIENLIPSLPGKQYQYGLLFVF